MGVVAAKAGEVIMAAVNTAAMITMMRTERVTQSSLF
jgi:hypothetical protein